MFCSKRGMASWLNPRAWRAGSTPPNLQVERASDDAKGHPSLPRRSPRSPARESANDSLEPSTRSSVKDLTSFFSGSGGATAASQSHTLAPGHLSASKGPLPVAPTAQVSSACPYFLPYSPPLAPPLLPPPTPQPPPPSLLTLPLSSSPPLVSLSRRPCAHVQPAAAAHQQLQLASAHADSF